MLTYRPCADHYPADDECHGEILDASGRVVANVWARSPNPDATSPRELVENDDPAGLARLFLAAPAVRALLAEAREALTDSPASHATATAQTESLAPLLERIDAALSGLPTDTEAGALDSPDPS